MVLDKQKIGQKLLTGRTGGGVGVSYGLVRYKQVGEGKSVPRPSPRADGQHANLSHGKKMGLGTDH